MRNTKKNLKMIKWQSEFYYGLWLSERKKRQEMEDLYKKQETEFNKFLDQQISEQLYKSDMLRTHLLTDIKYISKNALEVRFQMSNYRSN